MTWTAPREMAKEKLFHRLWYENERIKLEIDEHEKILELDKDTIHRMKEDHQINAKNHCKMLRQMRETNNDEINRKMYET